MLDTGIGVPKHPLFFLGRKYRSSTAQHLEAAKQRGQGAPEGAEVGLLGLLRLLGSLDAPCLSGSYWGVCFLGSKGGHAPAGVGQRAITCSAHALPTPCPLLSPPVQVLQVESDDAARERQRVAALLADGVSPFEARAPLPSRVPSSASILKQSPSQGDDSAGASLFLLLLCLAGERCCDPMRTELAALDRMQVWGKAHGCFCSAIVDGRPSLSHPPCR